MPRMPALAGPRYPRGSTASMSASPLAISCAGAFGRRSAMASPDLRQGPHEGRIQTFPRVGAALDGIDDRPQELGVHERSQAIATRAQLAHAGRCHHLGAGPEVVGGAIAANVPEGRNVESAHPIAGPPMGVTALLVQQPATRCVDTSRAARASGRGRTCAQRSAHSTSYMTRFRARSDLRLSAISALPAHGALPGGAGFAPPAPAAFGPAPGARAPASLRARVEPGRRPIPQGTPGIRRAAPSSRHAWNPAGGPHPPGRVRTREALQQGPDASLTTPGRVRTRAACVSAGPSLTTPLGSPAGARLRVLPRHPFPAPPPRPWRSQQGPRLQPTGRADEAAGEN